MRPAALALALAVVVACTAPPPSVATPSPSPEGDVLAVTVLLDLSGPRAAVGTEQRSAMELWRDQRQQTGARPEARLTFIDLAGSEARLLVELRRAAVESRADAVVIGAPVTYTDLLGRAIDLAAMPVLFTLPLDVADPVTRPGGRWAFALAPPLERVAAAAINDATDREALSPALVLARAARPGDRDAAAIADEMGRRGRDPFTEVVLEGATVPPVVRSALSVLRSVHCTATAVACAAVASEARSLGAPTFFYLPYLTTPTEVDDRPDLASRSVWPASRAIIAAEPATAARRRFLADHAQRHGPASSHAAAAFDALALLALAAASGGADDPARSRAAMEGITMPLIATTYSFSSQDHSGSDPEDLAFVQWTAGAVTYALPAIYGTGIPTPTPSPSLSASPSPSPSPSP